MWPLALAIAFFAALTSITAHAGETNRDAGLVGYWKFDEGRGSVVRDSAGTNHGMIHGASWSAGRLGTAMHFERATFEGAFVVISPAPALNFTNAFTLAAWVKVQNFETPILNKLDYWLAGNYDFKTQRDGRLRLSHETGQGVSDYDSTNRLTLGRWHHVAVTLVAGGDVCFYLDFQPAGRSPQRGHFGVLNHSPLRIGAKPDPYSWFQGKVDEVRIYNRALAEAEIKKLAVAAPPADETATATISTLGAPAASPAVSNDGIIRRQAAGAPGAVTNAFWPQWLGPNRDNRSAETGLLKRWPEGGPQLLWTANGLGEGYSTASIANGRIFTTGRVGTDEVLFALDLRGRLVWQATYGPAWIGRYPEARTTPTAEGDSVFVISGMGRVVCLDAASGRERWAAQAVEISGPNYHDWGIAESPLLDGDRLFCTPGGKQSTMVALDKRTGATLWTSPGLGDRHSYCSPILVRRGHRRLVVTMLENCVAGFDAESGKVLWQDRYADYQTAPHPIHPNSPVHHDGAIYTTSGYDNGGALLQLSENGDAVTRRWTDRTLDSHHGGAVWVDGHLYGSSFLGHRSGRWVCLDWETGRVGYEHRWLGKGALTFADGMLYCYEEQFGTVALVRPNPAQFDLVSSFQVTAGQGMHWAFPVVCGGRLYIRHGDTLLAYDVKARPKPEP